MFSSLYCQRTPRETVGVWETKWESIHTNSKRQRTHFQRGDLRYRAKSGEWKMIYAFVYSSGFTTVIKNICTRSNPVTLTFGITLIRVTNDWTWDHRQYETLMHDTDGYQNNHLFSRFRPLNWKLWIQSNLHDILANHIHKCAVRKVWVEKRRTHQHPHLRQDDCEHNGDKRAGPYYEGYVLQSMRRQRKRLL